MVVQGKDFGISRRAALRGISLGAVAIGIGACQPAAAPSPPSSPATPAPPPTQPPAQKAPSPAAGNKAEAPAPQPTTATKPQPNRPKQLTTLKLGLPTKNFLALPVYIAEKKGYFKEENLAVSIDYIAGNQTMLKGVIAGELDVSHSDTAGPITAVAEGANLKFIGTWASLIHFVVAAKKEINSLRDLYGKSIAISQPGSLPDVIIRKLFEGEGLDINKVDLVGVGGSPARAAAIVGGKVDASTFNVDELDLVEKVPNVHVLFYVKDKLPQYVRGAVFVSDKLLNEKPEALEALMRASLKGIRFAFDSPAETKALAAEMLEAPLSEQEQVYAYYAGLPLWEPNGLIERAHLDFMQQVNIDIGLQKAKIPVEKFLNQTPTERALATIGKYEIKNKPPVPKLAQ